MTNELSKNKNKREKWEKLMFSPKKICNIHKLIMKIQHNKNKLFNITSKNKT